MEDISKLLKPNSKCLGEEITNDMSFFIQVACGGPPDVMKKRNLSLLLCAILGFFGCLIFIIIIHVHYRQEMYILKNEFNKKASNSQDYTLELTIWNNQAATFEQDYFVSSKTKSQKITNNLLSLVENDKGNESYGF